MNEENNNQSDQATGEQKNSDKVQTELREIGEEELAQILRNHEIWVWSDGSKGVRADLSRTNLQSSNLSGTNLQKANFEGANLGNAKLIMADLYEAKLVNTNLKGTILDGANLKNADLQGAVGLLGVEFGGANLTGSLLPPDIVKFRSLEVSYEIIKDAKKLLIGQQSSLLFLCAYSWLTILTTNDVQLISDLQAITLPIIETKISVSVYYWLVPIALFSLYVYLGRLLKQLFTSVAILPAIFPDGRAIDDKGFPWIINSLLRSYFKPLRLIRRSILTNIQTFFLNLFLWFTIPITLLLFWMRYLPKHDWYGTQFHSLLVIMSIWTGILIHRDAISCFHRKKVRFRLKKSIYRRAFHLTIFLISLVLLGFISQFLLDGINPKFIQEGKYSAMDPKIFIPRILKKIGYDPLNINFRGVKLNWTDLANTNLRYADARGSSLIGSILDGSDCSHANLQWADLQKASLVKVDLEYANFRFAKLKYTDLSGSNLKNAKGLTQKQLDEACGDKHTVLPQDLFIKNCQDD